MKMGGMQTCDLVYEETNPEGHYFQDIFTVGTNIGHAWPIFVLRYIVCMNNCITIIPFVRSLSSMGASDVSSNYFTEHMQSLMAWLPICIFLKQWLSKWFKSDDDDDDGGDCNIVITYQHNHNMTINK